MKRLTKEKICFIAYAFGFSMVLVLAANMIGVAFTSLVLWKNLFTFLFYRAIFWIFVSSSMLIFALIMIFIYPEHFRKRDKMPVKGH